MSKTYLVIVAETKHTWTSAGNYAKIYCIASVKVSSMWSASSKISNLRWSVLKNFLSIICLILPGVPIATLTSPFFKAVLSSLVSVPPTNDFTFIPVYRLRFWNTKVICVASYRVGVNTKASTFGDGLSSWSVPIAKVAVFPVPACPWMIQSFLVKMAGTPWTCIDAGFS